MKTYKACPTSPPITIAQGLISMAPKQAPKDIDFSQYHAVAVAERSDIAHLIPKDKPLFGVDAALCGARPLMLGWREANHETGCRACAAEAVLA